MSKTTTVPGGIEKSATGACFLFGRETRIGPVPCCLIFWDRNEEIRSAGTVCRSVERTSSREESSHWNNAVCFGRIPAGRWGTPQDMEGAVIYLASKASDYVNGFTLAVDGGWLAR